MAGTATISTIKHDVTGAATRFNDGSGNEIGQLVKAWVNYTTATTSSVQRSFNHSSLTDNGTGDTTLSLTTAVADAYFCATGIGCRSTGAANFDPDPKITSSTASTYNIRSHDYNSDVAADAAVIGIALFR